MTDQDYPIKDLKTEFLFRIDLAAEYQADVVTGLKGTPWGDLVNIPVTGGMVSGPHVNGQVANMGGDWGVATTRECRNFDTGEDEETRVTELDCKLVIKTNDSPPAMIEMIYTGTSYGTKDGYSYFRTLPRFRTASPKYVYLNSAIAVANGTHRKNEGPVYDVYLVL